MRYIKINLNRFSAFRELPSGTYIITVKAVGTGTNTNSNISSGTTCVKQ